MFTGVGFVFSIGMSDERILGYHWDWSFFKFRNYGFPMELS
jgi:hypothetical protein